MPIKTKSYYLQVAPAGFNELIPRKLLSLQCQ